MELSNINKAIAGGLAGLLVAELARFGFQPDDVTKNALNVLLTALVGYAVGHIIVYLSPKNKERK